MSGNFSGIVGPCSLRETRGDLPYILALKYLILVQTETKTKINFPLRPLRKMRGNSGGDSG
jgi:hypothetical protein